jgi:hypothetical protein
MTPRSLLRLEGLTVAAGAVGAYYLLDGPLWLFVLLAFAPDLGMVGYLAGPRVGSRVYNLLHTYTLPAILGAVGVVTGPELLTLVALVWAGHIGVDRAVGYGLKYPTVFHDTHLGRVGRVRTDAKTVKPDTVTDPVSGRTN